MPSLGELGGRVQECVAAEPVVSDICRYGGHDGANGILRIRMRCNDRLEVSHLCGVPGLNVEEDQSVFGPIVLVKRRLGDA